MNCKPGDLAIVVGSSPYAGRLVEVLHPAPTVDFMLPDGWKHEPADPDSWVIKSIGTPFDVVDWNGRPYRQAMYGAGRDAYLRPLPGEPETQSERSEEKLNA